MAVAAGKAEKILLTKEGKDLLNVLIEAGAGKAPVKSARLSGKISPEAYSELKKFDDKVIKTEGRGLGATIKVMVSPDKISPETAPSRIIKTRASRGSKSASSNGSASRSEGSNLFSRDKDYLRENVRSYLAFATGIEARKHEERRQAEDSIDRVATRAKELRAEAKKNGHPLSTGDALRQAQAEVDMPFEALLQVKWRPIMFEIFGISDAADTTQRDMRS